MQRPWNGIAIVLAAAGVLVSAGDALAGDNHGWEGKRRISEQRPNDLFYNYYVGPQPSGTAAGMYPAPLPVPAHVGHTYTTYQPLMPHELMYQHKRSYYTHNPGAGWTRTNVRYKTAGSIWQSRNFGLYDNTFGAWLKEGYFNARSIAPWRMYW